MTVMLDINVLLDVFLSRSPHYTASAQVLSLVANRQLTGIVAAHGLTTLYYLARKQADRTLAENAVDYVIQHCQISSLNNPGWRRARALDFSDFEDAVVASIAEETGCESIVTRNKSHFFRSKVAATTPLDFLLIFPAG